MGPSARDTPIRQPHTTRLKPASVVDCATCCVWQHCNIDKKQDRMLRCVSALRHITFALSRALRERSSSRVPVAIAAPKSHVNGEPPPHTESVRPFTCTQPSMHRRQEPCLFCSVLFCSVLSVRINFIASREHGWSRVPGLVLLVWPSSHTTAVHNCVCSAQASTRLVLSSVRACQVSADQLTN